MNEKIFHTLKLVGVAGLVTGIISITVGVTVGVIAIISGAQALRARKHIIF